jgi:rhodanese-related sulfurtransferase
MEKKFFWMIIVLGIITSIMTTNIGIAVSYTIIDSNHLIETNDEMNVIESTSVGYTNITIEEVWELISIPSNGIQFLIDVRTPGEFFDERIYTSSLREKPRLFPVQLMQLEGFLLQYFMLRYANQEIILYCRSANRSFIATKILLDYGFSGTIYNMIGGINDWKTAELPTVKGRL